MMHASPSDWTVADVVAHLGMERHRRGGWFSPHYSDGEVRGRPRVSAFYYLLPGDEPVALHKIDAVEIWHHYLGAPAIFEISNGGQMRLSSTLGRDLLAGERPQLAVPSHFWQAYRSLGAWSLLGCTMAPGQSSHAQVLGEDL